jgi:hypothetical protein
MDETWMIARACNGDRSNYYRGILTLRDCEEVYEEASQIEVQAAGAEDQA